MQHQDVGLGPEQDDVGRHPVDLAREEQPVALVRAQDADRADATTLELREDAVERQVTRRVREVRREGRQPIARGGRVFEP